MPFNRLVVFILGPAITLASGAIAGVGAKYGLGFTPKSVAGALTTGILIGTPMVLSHRKIQKFIDGWQAYEKRADDATNGALSAEMNNVVALIARKTGTPLPGDPVAVPVANVTNVYTDAAPATEGPTAEQPPPVATPGAFEGSNGPTA